MACPNCAAALSTPVLELVGLFMGAPFVVFAAVALLVRRALTQRPR
jgi:hypothetical protein